MEATRVSSNIVVSLLCVIVVTVLVKVVKWVWLWPKMVETMLRKQGLPGSSYRLLFGDLRDLSSQRAQAMAQPMSAFSHDYLPRLNPYVHHLITKFGKVLFMWSGPKPTVVISKAELIKEALAKMHEIQKPKINPLVDKHFAGFINYEGQQWAQHRQMVNPAFHLEKLKLLLPAFYESCEEMINKLEELVAERDPTEVDIWPHISTLSADVISRAAFGSSYKEGQEIFQLLNEQSCLALSMLQSPYVPGLRYVPTPTNKKFKSNLAEIDRIVKGIIEKRKKAIEAGEVVKDDLLGILMNSYTETQTGNCKNEKFGIGYQELIDDCKLFYIAGQETTSVLLVWTLIMLSYYQDWQTQAREEVSQVFGSHAPSFEGLNRLKTVTMILYEVLRLYPQSPQIPRRIAKDTKLGDLVLPAGSLLNLEIAYVHRDKELWGEDAEEFKPDRFCQGVSKATKGIHAFFAFGWGPRICIGEKFAMMEAKVALSMILQRFSFELSPSYAHSPMAVFSTRPQHGAQIILHRLQ